MSREAQAAAPQTASEPTVEAGAAPTSEDLGGPAALLLRPGALAALPAVGNGHDIRHRAIRRMQRDVGNQRVQRLLSRSLVQRQKSGGGGDTTPIPKLPDASARKNYAFDMLKKAFGGRIKVEAKVVGVASEDQIRAEYDQAMIRQGKKFREPAAEGEEGELRDWQPGDAAKHPALGQKGFKGFSDPSTGQIFVDTSKEPDDQVATIVHEQLHANSAGDFVATLGKAIDEGVTETLTQKAFTASGHAAPTGDYVNEVSFVGDLGAMFGMGTLESAYFGGVNALRTMMNAATDTDIFSEFAAAARAGRRSWMKKFFKEYYEELTNGSELDKKVAAINMALDGWVSDEDIANIAGIYQGATDSDKPHLRAAALARVTELTDHGQRADLRFAVGA